MSEQLYLFLLKTFYRKSTSTMIGLLCRGLVETFFILPLAFCFIFACIDFCFSLFLCLWLFCVAGNGLLDVHRLLLFCTP